MNIAQQITMGATRRRFLKTMLAAPVVASAVNNPVAEALPLPKRKTPVFAQVRGAGQAGNRLLISPTSERIAIGDCFIIETVGAIRNPAKPPVIHCVFVATENRDAGSTEMVIFPAIMPCGEYQNVNKSPENGRVIRRYFPSMGMLEI